MLTSTKTVSGKEIDALKRSEGYIEMVTVQCEECSELRQIKYSSYLHLQYTNDDDKKTYCKPCGTKIKQSVKIEDHIIELIKTEYESGTSIAKLCKIFKKSNRKISEILKKSNAIKPDSKLKCRVCKENKPHKCFMQSEYVCISCFEIKPIKKRITKKVDYIPEKIANPKKRPIGTWVDEWKNAQHELQNGKCQICSKLMQNPFVDHCHQTGKLRSLLCPGCNSGIGMFLEDTFIMKKAMEYLKENIC